MYHREVLVWPLFLGVRVSMAGINKYKGITKISKSSSAPLLLRAGMGGYQ
jgi:hypothetical protein